MARYQSGVTWAQAQQACVSLGANLTGIASNVESYFIRQCVMLEQLRYLIVLLAAVDVK